MRILGEFTSSAKQGKLLGENSDVSWKRDQRS